VKRQQIRFIYKYKNEFFKFLSIFTSNDNSFHFHLYEESGKPFNYYGISKTDAGVLKIDIQNPISSNFLRHNFTFHKSGYIHSTKKNSERYKDGVKGIPFNKIQASNLILLLAPKKVSLLEKYIPRKDGHNFILELKENQQPFTLNFEVFRVSQLGNLPKTPMDIENGPHTYHWVDLKFGLRFYLQSVKGTELWPESTLVLKRINE